MPKVELSPEEQTLETIQKQLDEIEDKIAKETREIEKKYSTDREPLLKQRDEVIKTIPDFWKQAVENNLMIVGTMAEQDIEILDYLVGLHVEEFYDVVDGYKITLTFKPGNPYFSNETISKSFRFDTEAEKYNIEATKIEWTAGKNLVEENKKLIDEGEDENAEEGIIEDPLLSWFGSWEDKEENEEGDEIAECIREEIWSQPGKFFRLQREMEAEDGEEEAKN